MAHDLSPQPVLPPVQEAAPAAGRSALVRRVLVGGFLGLAWGASLRAWMALLAVELVDRPRVTWLGAFGGILLPAAVVGALLGAAAYDAATSQSKRWRWAILSPLVLAIAAAVATENFVSRLITTGMGGGAIGVALIGLLGGFALSGFGWRWLRWVAGALATLPTIAGSATAATLSASTVFGALLFVLLMLLLIAGVSAPSRFQADQHYAGWRAE